MRLIKDKTYLISLRLFYADSAAETSLMVW
jgi:hypothetical protein